MERLRVHGPCHSGKPINSLLAPLPFFQALCGSKEVSGLVLFDPSLENAELLISWLQYRSNATVVRDVCFSEQQLVTECIKDMILHGNEPPLSEFVHFDVRKVSAQFLRDWIAWYGVVPPPEALADGEVLRPRKWWEEIVSKEMVETSAWEKRAQQTLMEAPPKITRARIRTLLRAVTGARSAKHRALETLELLNDKVLVKMGHRAFDRIQRSLDAARFPEEQRAQVFRDLQEPPAEKSLLQEVARSVTGVVYGAHTTSLEYYRQLTSVNGKVSADKIVVAKEPGASESSSSSFAHVFAVKEAKKRLIKGAARFPIAFITATATRYMEDEEFRKRTGFGTSALHQPLANIALASLKSGSSGAMQSILEELFKDGWKSDPKRSIVQSAIRDALLMSIIPAMSGK